MHDWECRNEACTEFGQPLAADEPLVSNPLADDERAPRADQRR